MARISLMQVKKSLAGTWAKESDLSETYEFEFLSELSWTCTRKNNQGDRKFRLTYDRTGEKLWWGESYFLDPIELNSKPAKAVWYRASDKAQKKGAFVWRKTKEATAAELRAIEALARVPTKVGGKSASKGAAAAIGGGPAVRKAAAEPVVKVAVAARAAAQDVSDVSKPAPGRSSFPPWPQPEVVLDIEQMLVLYKPPYWKCELPSADALDEPHQERKKENPLLLRWIKDKVSDIDSELYKEDFNPALSGTGFGPLSHRIDQETSGLLLVAKTKGAQRHLKSQFHKTEVSKRYICLVRGKMTKAGGLIDAKIRTIRTDMMTRSEVSSSGEWAETEYQVVATYGDTGAEGQKAYSLVACDIKTGRTHQIRVHMAHLGHPLVADDKYLSEAQLQEDRRSVCPRLFLHSYRLRFQDLRGEQRLVLCPLPDDLRFALVKLGAADPTGPSSDSLFGETSWQQDLFRPEVLQWRPGTRVVRRVAALARDAAAPLTLNHLCEDAELKQLMAAEGVPDLGRSWLSRHWGIFEAVLLPGGSDLGLRLRPAHSGGDESVEDSLERKIEAVRSELEELQRLKQRAVAEEEYGEAAEIKRRAEATSAELASLLQIMEDPAGANLDGLSSGGGSGAQQEDVQKNISKKQKPKAKAFQQDVQDEALFPSLIPTKVKPTPKRATAAVAESAIAGLAVSGTAASSSALAGVVGVTAPEPQVVTLKDALVEFLKRREKDGCIAHINEVNNDKFIRQVMAAQQPKPVQAVNKVWLKSHEQVFVLLRTADNEMYVGLKQAVEKVAGKSAKATSSDQPKCPAYQNVIQSAGAGGTKPLVYQYSAAARDTSQAEAEQAQLGEWHSKFLAVLRESPQRSCSAAELLTAVPAFADAMGVRKGREQQELLALFLESCPPAFRVETRSSGPEREYIIWAK